MRPRTRFAPSPTGDLHVGGAFTALASHALGGLRVLRMEDLDGPRTVAGSAARIVEDLRWLGLAYDEGPSEEGSCGPYMQSARFSRYEAALTTLRARGLLYPCDCSRKELAEVGRAPHTSEPVYPGFCRDKDPARSFQRPPALRVRVAAGARVRFVDQLTGTVVSERVDRQVGDFVLRRGDGVYAYQLAVAVDDAQMQITHVVRGRDLLGSTTRQIYLQQLLELPSPSYWLHVPLVVTPEGARLAKRLRSVRIRALREAGIGAQEIVGALAHALGLRDAPTPCAVDEVRLDPSEAAQRLTRTSFEVPAAWIANAS